MRKEWRVSYTSKGGAASVTIFSEPEDTERAAREFAKLIRAHDWVHSNSVHVEEREVGAWRAVAIEQGGG